MKANIVDLRYRMKNILKALDRNESVTVLYHGQEKAIITPIRSKIKKSIKDHPFFGMKSNTAETVEQTMERLRGERY
mgnify:CR=1 FL=1